MLTFIQLSLLILITISGILSAYLFLFPLPIGFLFGFLTLLYFLRGIGISQTTVWEGAKNGAYRTKEVIWILGLVGVVIPSWTAAGTIPYMIDLGLSMLHPDFFLTYSFFLTAFISMILGTSIGSLSSIGLPLIGAGAILQIPLPFVAGALVSGAMVGDRTSPLSSAFQLVAASTETDPRHQGKSLLPTTLAAIGLSGICFFLLDGFGDRTSAMTGVQGYSFTVWFKLTPWLLLPPALLIGAILLRVKTKYAFLLSIACSIIMGSILQGIHNGQWIHYILQGFDETNMLILHSKGLFDMVELMIFIGLTGAFNGILEKTQIIQPYMVQVLGKSSSLTAGTCRAALFGLAMNLVACNQTLPIMITGRNLLPIWQQKFKKEHLSRVIADTGLIFAALIPWNMLALLAGTLLGVPVVHYIPYAFFLWSLPLWTIGLSILYDLRKKPMEDKEMKRQIMR